MSEIRRRRSGPGSERHTALMSAGSGDGRWVEPHSPHDGECHQGERDRHREAGTDTCQDPGCHDERPAQGRREEDRYAAEDRLDGESDRAASGRQGIAHHGKQGRARHAGPAHDEQEPDEDDRPDRRGRDDDVADGGERHEEEERPPAAVVVAHPAAGILVEPVERVLHAAVRADREDRSAKGLEVLGQEPAPEVLPERHEKHGGHDGERVPLEREQLAHAAEASRLDHRQLEVMSHEHWKRIYRTKDLTEVSWYLA